MGADASLPAKAFDDVWFDEFYDRALPVVFGYLLRLCGGDREQAWDLTQDSWVTVVDRLAQGQTDKATVGFLLSVARSRYLDAWRRQRRLQRKLRLVWAAAREVGDPGGVGGQGARSSVGLLRRAPGGADAGLRRRHTGRGDRRAVGVVRLFHVLAARPGTRRAAQPPHRRSDMTNHHDELRVAPDPSRAEELRRRLHARLASGYPDEPVVPIQDVLVSIPSADTDPDDREGDIIMLETEDRPTGHEPVTPRRRSPGRWLLVAAAAAVVAVVGTLLVAAGGDDEDQVDTAADPHDRALPAPAQDIMECRAVEGFAHLEPGRYFVDPDGDDTTPLRVTYQVAAEGWAAWFGAVKFTGPGAHGVEHHHGDEPGQRRLSRSHPARPTRGPDRRRPRDRAEPAGAVRGDRTADRRDALRLPGEAPRADRAGRTRGACGLRRRRAAQLDLTAQRTGRSPGTTAPGQTEEFWILDVEGTRLVLVKFDSPQSSAEDIAERDAIFDSIRIEP